MFAFVFEIAIFASLAGILFVSLRTLPRVSNEVFTENRSRIRAHEFMLFIERADVVLKVLFEKFLRRLKVIILKFDNFLTKKISDLKKEQPSIKNSFVIETIEEEIKITPEGVSVDSSDESEPFVVETLKIEEKRVRKRKRKV